jgi:Bacteriocin-protection, YdeI or OmpD-Associated
MAKKISSGTVHGLPADLRKALAADPKALAKWEDITPLARNEWICWTISVKQTETRRQHVKRVCSELKEGMRRPCCWIGCVHRSEKPISPSVQYVLSKKSASKKRSARLKGRRIQ